MSSFISRETIQQIQAAGQKRPHPSKAPPPKGQTCQRCGASFRWERSSDGFVMCLVKPSDSCDCGYGRALGAKRDEETP